ncbi:VIT1/CCC1 transporter family protein [Nitrospira sp. Kam-Ns4a]
MPTDTSSPLDPRLARTLILDELFDLSLYQALRDVSQGDVQVMLEELIEIETKHLAFWQEAFSLKLNALDLPRRIKLWLLVTLCRLVGEPAIHLVLQAIEVYGIRKYLSLWKRHQESPLAAGVKAILLDEFKHEDRIVTRIEQRKINPERIRNIFLGLNDGLVEILGAVSGFFGAFGDATTVLIAAATTAVAGSLSMGAGAYVAMGSEREVRKAEADKRQFLGEAMDGADPIERPVGAALVVGASYFAGAMIPVLPVLVGATSALASALTAGAVVALVSTVLAFLAGMDIRQRILINLAILAGAVAVTYAIGTIARSLWGIPV